MEKKLEELVEKVKNGDNDAFLELMQLYENPLRNYLSNLCRNNQYDIEEVIQLTYISVWKKIKQLNNPKAFPYWLKTIAHNKAITLFEKNKCIIIPTEEFSDKSNDPNNSYYNPTCYMNNKTEREIIHQLIYKLPIIQQEVLNLFYFHHLSIKEISIKLNIPEGTVKSRLFKAKHKFNKIIQEYEQQEGRKLNFQIEIITPGIFLFLFQKLLENKKYVFSQLVTIGVCISTSFMLLNQAKIIPEGKPVEANLFESDKNKFQAVKYKGHYVNSADEAYYIILKIAPTLKDLKSLSISEILELKDIVTELKKDNSAYLSTLTNNGWIKTYDKILISQ